MNKVIGHLKTINKHKYMVTKLCFRCHYTNKESCTISANTLFVN